MRTARCFAPPELGVGYYHCVSRVVDRRFIFGDVEKADFVTLMRMYERLCGVRVLTKECHWGQTLYLPEKVRSDPDRDKVSNAVEYLLGTNPRLMDYAIPNTALRTGFDGNVDFASYRTGFGGYVGRHTNPVSPLALIRIEPIQGTSQVVYPGEKLTAPIVVSVTQNGKPVSSLLVKFSGIAGTKPQRDRHFIGNAVDSVLGFDSLGAVMRTARCFAPPELGVGYYHCVSRVVDRRFIFGDVEKADFVTLMRMYERLCGVRVLTYCLMSNHFHLLVEVPQKPEAEKMPSEAELLELIEKVYGKQKALMLRQEWAEWRQIAPDGHGDARVRKAVDAWLGRMWDISAFMKILKQRFTQWYNTKNARKGTLWEERFKSTLVQGGDALATVAAYVDLNPVRAGIVKDAKDYRWGGYGASCGGVKIAKLGLGRVMELSSVRVDASNSKAVMREYRKRLLLWGVEQGVTAAGKPVKRGIDPRKAAKELERTGGELGAAATLLCRIRYFTEGMVIGKREFAEQMFSAWRDRFGPNRKDGARRVKGLDPGLGMFALRNLG